MDANLEAIEEAAPSLEDRVARLELVNELLLAELRRHIGGFVLVAPEA